MTFQEKCDRNLHNTFPKIDDLYFYFTKYFAINRFNNIGLIWLYQATVQNVMYWYICSNLK